jgi:hypothetical protein
LIGVRIGFGLDALTLLWGFVFSGCCLSFGLFFECFSEGIILDNFLLCLRFIGADIVCESILSVLEQKFSVEVLKKVHFLIYGFTSKSDLSLADF